MSASAEHAAEELQATLSSISTKDLVDELAKREGVKDYLISTYGNYHLEPEPYDDIFEMGPARILVVID